MTKKAFFTMFRGTNQIGGCSCAFYLGERRIIIDFGANLPGTENPEINDRKLVDMVFGNKKDIDSTDAVLFTHYHGDHVGLKRSIPEKVPIYIGKTAKEIMKIIAKRVDKIKPVQEAESPLIERMKPYWTAGEKMDFSGIDVTPLYTDHSALDAYMFVIEMNGKRILYTGDFRDHGITGGNSFERLIKKYVGKVDILITEGTMLSRESETNHNTIKTEDDLGRRAAKIFREHKENIVLVSSTNIDSIMQFYHATDEDKDFICDDYQAEIIHTANQAKYLNYPEYQYNKKRKIKVICPENKSVYECGLDSRFYEKFEYDDIKKNGFVMLVRENKKYLFEDLIKQMKEPFIVYSKWTGYLKEGKCPDKAVVDFMDKFYDGNNREILHTSGHAYIETLAKIIDEVEPKVIIPMHTENAKGFIENPVFEKYRDGVKILHDREIFDIDNMEVVKNV